MEIRAKFNILIASADNVSKHALMCFAWIFAISWVIAPRFPFAKDQSSEWAGGLDIAPGRFKYHVFIMPLGTSFNYSAISTINL